MKRERISDIRRGLEPSAELKRRVAERAAALEAGKKSIGGESITAERSSYTEIYKDEKENIKMSIIRTDHEAARLKKRLPAVISAAAACAVLAVGGIALGMRGGDSELAANRSDTSAAAQTEVTDAEDIPILENKDQADDAIVKSTDERDGGFDPDRSVAEYLEAEGLADNPDAKGYVVIPGMLSYPVMQGSDNDYYLSHASDGTEDTYGSIMADYVVPITETKRAENVILHGRTILDSDEMFSRLHEYEGENADKTLEENRYIYFGTVGEKKLSRYVIIGIGELFADSWAAHGIKKNQVVKKEDADKYELDFFDYWRYRNFGEDVFTFEYWINGIEENCSYHQTDGCTADDDYLTLSTGAVEKGLFGFEKFNDDKRLVIFARRLRDEELNTTVPDLNGKTLEEAVKTLIQSSLAYEIATIDSPEEKGKIIEQSIKAGETVEKGTVITFYISSGVKYTDMSLKIPLPDGLKGAYTIDIFRNGNIAYTKTVTNAEELSSNAAWVDITGSEPERLEVYIRRADTDEENNIRYATFDVDYSAESSELIGECCMEELLALSGAE